MASGVLNLKSQPSGYYDSLRDEMLKYIPTGVKRTLEFGCGTGGFSALLKDKFSVESWGVEMDSTAASKAAEKLDKVLVSDALLSLADIPDEYFDCVIFFDVLEHLADPYSLLTSIKQKMTSQGVVVISIPNIRYYRTFYDLVVHGNWDYKDHGVLDITHLRFFTKKSICKMFDQIGYEIITLEGMHPTKSRTYKILNAVLLNMIADVRYKHFAIVARPK